MRHLPDDVDTGPDAGPVTGLVRVDLDALDLARRQLDLVPQALLASRAALRSVGEGLPSWISEDAGAGTVRRLLEDLGDAAASGLADADDLLSDLRRAAGDYALVEHAATAPRGGS